MGQHADNRLIRHAKDSYEGSFSTDLLEQYKLYVQSAENVSARRVASSRYLLSLNVALAALYGLQSAGFGQSFLAVADSRYRNSRFLALVLDHQVTCRPEPRQVQSHSRIRAASASGDVQV